MSRFHQSQAWTNLRARAVAAARKADAPCPVCGHPIDWTASGRTAWGPSGDHIISVALDPTRALDPSNIRVTHRKCNTSPTHRQVAGMDRARQGRPQEPARAPQPAPRAQWTPQPWARAYAAFMEREKPGGNPDAYLRNSRPWCADWTREDFDAGRVTEDGRRR